MSEDYGNIYRDEAAQNTEPLQPINDDPPEPLAPDMGADPEPMQDVDPAEENPTEERTIEAIPDEDPGELDDSFYEPPDFEVPDEDDEDAPPTPAQDVFAKVFPAAFGDGGTGTLTAWGQGSGGTWIEETIINDGTHSNMVTYTDGRSCNSFAAPSAMTFPEEGCVLTVEYPDLTDNVYLGLPNGDFNVYVTQTGGSNGDDGSTTTAAFPTYTYDVFVDAAKKKKIGTAVSVQWHRPLKIAVTAGTHGKARIEGKTLILLEVDEYFDRTDCP